MKQVRAINIRLEFPNVYKIPERTSAENKHKLKMRAMLTPKNTLVVASSAGFPCFHLPFLSPLQFSSALAESSERPGL